MYVKSRDELVEDGSEEDKGEERGGEFVIMDGEATLAFDSVKNFRCGDGGDRDGGRRAGAAAVASARNASGLADQANAFTEAVGVEALAGKQDSAAQKNRCDSMAGTSLRGPLAGSARQRDPGCPPKR